MEIGSQTDLKLLPLGGLGEIGMNMMALAWGREAVLIDAGLMFPDESMPGVDLVIPDPDVLIAQEWNVLGIVLTHGHEDHIGALPYLLSRIQAPVYGTSFTIGLVEYKLEEFGLLGSTELHTVAAKTALHLGPFQIEFFPVCHSISDSVGLAIRTPVGLILHSGDFKLDPNPINGRASDLDAIAAYADEGVLALLSDSTNAEVGGWTGSEISIRPTLQRLFADAPGRVLFATFSSNTHRIQQVLDLSHQHDRKVILVGRSMEAVVGIASERGCLSVPPGILADVRDLNTLADQEITVLSTGSQGEPLSALSLMAWDRHKYLRIKTGDLLILSSRFIPGNEKAITQIINEFSRRGARVEYEKISSVHVSGHACREELRHLIRVARPRHFVPVHGEYRHLVQHAALAAEEGMPEESVLIAQDGDLVSFTKDTAAIIGRVEPRRVFVDGKGVGDVSSDVLRDRRALSEKGVVTVVLGVGRYSGELMSGPEVFSTGVTGGELEPELLQATCSAVAERVSEIAPKSLDQWNEAKEEIRLAARRHINRTLGRRPTVQTVILFV